MSVDDAVMEAVAQAIKQADDEYQMAESVQMPFASWSDHLARAVLDALAHLSRGDAS